MLPWLIPECHKLGSRVRRQDSLKNVDIAAAERPRRPSGQSCVYGQIDSYLSSCRAKKNRVLLLLRATSFALSSNLECFWKRAPQVRFDPRSNRLVLRGTLESLSGHLLINCQRQLLVAGL